MFQKIESKRPNNSFKEGDTVANDKKTMLLREGRENRWENNSHGQQKLVK